MQIRIIIPRSKCLRYVFPGGKLWSHITKYLHEGSPDESFDISFIQKSHTTGTVYCAGPSNGSESSGSRPGVEFPEDLESEEPQSGLPAHVKSNHETLRPGSIKPSEEEQCTSSYLTLCHEYEQEKVEPEVLGEEEGTREAEEDSGDLGGDCSGAEALARSYQCSLMSSDSLCSPVLQRFFTDDDELTDPPTLDSLDQSKRSPMSLFRIDSKDSCDTSRVLLTTSDLGSEVTEVTEDPLEIGEVVEVKGHLSDLWRFDGDRGSNESVPVISFKEALAEDANTGCADEGQPPDLLVNLPGVGGASGTEGRDLDEEFTVAVEAKASPQLGKPDVLQLGQEAGLNLAVEEDTSTDMLSILYEETDASERFPTPLDFISCRKDPQSFTGSETATDQKEGKSVSEIFRELDELAEVALNTHLPEALVRNWAVDIVLALEALHQEGIICKDLNPNNLLLDHRGKTHLQPRTSV